MAKPDVNALNSNPEVLRRAKAVQDLLKRGNSWLSRSAEGQAALQRAQEALYELVPRPTGNDTWTIDPGSGKLEYHLNRGATALKAIGAGAALGAAGIVGGAALAPALAGAGGGGVSAATGAGSGVGTGAAAGGAGAAAGGTAAATGGFLSAVPLSSLVSAGTGLGGAWMAARAQKQASRDQLTASREANRIAEDAQRRAEEFQREQMDYDRWLQGATAEARRPYLEQAMALMGGGPAYQPETFQEAAPFVAPTQEEATNDPGYQAMLKEGQNRIENSAAMQGTLNTGGLIKDVQQYGQNMGAARYEDVYNRRMNAYTLREQLRGQAYDRNAQAGYQAASLNQSASMGRISDLLALAGMATPGQYPGYGGGGGNAFLPRQPGSAIRGADSGQRRPWLLPPGVGDPLERRELNYA